MPGLAMMLSYVRTLFMPEHVNGEMLRAAMRRVPSPVTVVTATDGRELRGITIGSFTSVSLAPPLISFNVAHASRMHALLTTRAERFAVHILSEEQAHLSDHFAVPNRTGDEQFAGLGFRRDAYGTPLLDDVLAIFHCARYAVYPAGDHSLLIGEVLKVERRAEGAPLLYFDRTYRNVGEPVQHSLFTPVNADGSETP